MSSTFEDIFLADEALETEGAWVDVAAGVRFKIAATGPSNPKFVKAAERIFKPYRRQIQQNALDNETARKLQAKIYAESILLDWEGVTLGGEALPYSRENAERLLLESWRVMRFVDERAGDVATFQAAGLEDEAGN